MLPADSPFASLPSPGPHPATAELRAYAAGALPPADEHRIEAHALDCERCAELLEGFSMSDAATTDQALADLRTRLQARVGADAPASTLRPARQLLWPRLAAAVALLGAVGGGIWGWEQQHPTPEVATAAPAANSQASPAVAAIAKPPQTPSAPRPAATTPAAATAGRPADYAAVKPRNRAAGPRLFRRPAQHAAPILTDQGTNAAEASDGIARQAAPAATEAQKLTGRATPASAGELAANVATEKTADPGVAAALPATLAKAPALADSITPGQQEGIVSRFSKANAFESAALVRDKPMPAAMAIAPAPVAGTPALHTYLHREAAKFELEEGAKPLHGTVRLRFMVGADGKLSNLQVVRGLRADYDEEALRIVCEGPAWRPGIAGGRRTALPMEITISF